MLNETLREELLARAAEDAAVRTELAADGSLFQGYHPRMEEVHRRNGLRLSALLDEHGWLGKSLVGEDGAAAAWRIAQHAIGLPALQRRCLALVREAVARGEVPAAMAAMLDDRIRFYEGRPQLYGTQFDYDDEGRMTPWIIEDPAHVNERRRAVGLDPIEERTAAYRAQQRPQDRPHDLAAHRRGFADWLRRVGWRTE